MKHLLVTLAIMTLSLSALKAIDNNDSTVRIIGMNVYHSSSESGYGSSVNLNISIERERRHLEIGLVMQQESGSIRGGEVVYRHYLSSPFKESNSGTELYRNLRVYFQYNFIFRKTNHSGSFESIMPGMNDESQISGGRVATFEHYLGAGAQVRLIENLYLNAGLGYGTILGSIDRKFQDEAHYTMGGRKSDFGLVTKFGLGYFFKR